MPIPMMIYWPCCAVARDLLAPFADAIATNDAGGCTFALSGARTRALCQIFDAMLRKSPRARRNYCRAVIGTSRLMAKVSELKGWNRPSSML